MKQFVKIYGFSMIMQGPCIKMQAEAIPGGSGKRLDPSRERATNLTGKKPGDRLSAPPGNSSKAE
jgi:hypothetical protein